MATVVDLDGVIERCQQAMREFGKGNPEHMKALYSHREDVTRVVTPELAYVVWVEYHRSKIGERNEIVDVPLRVTIIFRLEDDTWKIVHRHTDTVTTPRPHESMIQE